MYIIDFRGHYCAVQKFEAASNAAAVAEAEIRRAGLTAELWDELRPIARLPKLTARSDRGLPR